MCFFKEAVLAILSNFSCAGSNAPPLTPVSSSTTPRASGATRDPLGPPLTVGHRIDPLRRSGARTQAPSAAVLERDLMAVGKRAGGGGWVNIFNLTILCDFYLDFDYSGLFSLVQLQKTRAQHSNASRLAAIRCEAAEKSGNLDFSSKIRTFVDFRHPPPHGISIGSEILYLF